MYMTQLPVASDTSTQAHLNTISYVSTGLLWGHVGGASSTHGCRVNMSQQLQNLPHKP